MKTFIPTLVAVAMFAGASYAQTDSSECSCSGSKSSTGQSSSCSSSKGGSCGCASKATSMISVAINSQQQQTQQEQTSTLTDADKLQISVQKICPVMGKELGSMGDPIKVKAGDQVVFLCCMGCQGKQLNAEHWGSIQANIAKAQQTCPIMGKPVTSEMESTVVDGQRVFVCCPPCIEKIQADTKTAMQKVNANYVSFVKAEAQAKSDQIHIKAQGICPVSGQKLGSMGAPIKVKVGEEEHAFLCCKGCQGKQLKAEHWATVQANLAKAQGICPVMGEPVDSSMKSTVVNGRKIFVCCPPCIEKIDAAPAEFVAKLDAQIANGGKAASESNDGHDRSTQKHDN